MNCEKCGKGMKDGVDLFRQNAKGETGRWRCAMCNQLPVDPLVEEITEAIHAAAAIEKAKP